MIYVKSVIIEKYLINRGYYELFRKKNIKRWDCFK